MKQKLVLLLFLAIFLLSGCNNLMNTPSRRVESLLSKYQKLDDDVVNQLDEVMSDETMLTNEQQDRYIGLMKRQYSNLTYTIKDEVIDGKTAVVEVEIEVYDYNKAITDLEDYLVNNSSEFESSNGEIDNVKYNNRKLDAIEDMKDRVTYTINFTLSKIEDKWIVDDLTETERMKIHGLYAY